MSTDYKKDTKITLVSLPLVSLRTGVPHTSHSRPLAPLTFRLQLPNAENHLYLYTAQEPTNTVWLTLYELQVK